MLHPAPGLKAKGGRKFGRKKGRKEGRKAGNNNDGERWRNKGREGGREEGGLFINSIYIYPISPSYSSKILKKKGKQMFHAQSPCGQVN